MKFEGYTNRRVLIVDDQKEIHDDFAEILNPRSLASSGRELASAFLAEEEPPGLPDFEMLHARSGEDACGIVSAGKEADRPVAVAYVDIRMPPGMDGIETIGRIRKIDPDIEVVIMTAYTDRSLLDVVETVGPLHKVLYVRKPFAREEIQQITLSLVGKWNVERKLAESRRQLSIGYTRLESVLNASRQAMALYDRDGRLLFANQGYQTLAGLTEIELKELDLDAATARFKERFHEPELPALERESVFGDVGELVEQRGNGKAGESRLFYRATSRVRDSGGTVVGDLHVYRDVSGDVESERMKAELLRLRTKLAEATESVEGMVGASRPMQQVYALIRQAAGSDITVLIRGESGTGKELVARMLHANSPRNKGPFVALNCAAIPEALMESELFGHEHGAFTGATQRRIGAFERANRGTILLDEIGDMQPALQAKLLRVLQEREVQRVGGSGNTPVDVRVIVATNKNLEGAVKEGDFREDLLYRVAAFPIEIPPLRQRRGDITMLADHFLKIYTQRSGRPLRGISSAASRMLLQYDWPGNVRELDNAIERAVLLEQTDVLQAESLPPQLFRRRARSERRLAVAAPSLVDVEREALAQALEATGNNITQAARALGINRVTLHRKLKRYGLTDRD